MLSEPLNPVAKPRCRCDIPSTRGPLLPPDILKNKRRRGRRVALGCCLARAGTLRRGRPKCQRRSKNFAPNAFVRIGRDGRVVLIVCQVEMGQGTYTSMPMLIAEELEVDLNQVDVEARSARRQALRQSSREFQVTGGSTSVRAFWKPLREAGAAARILLVEAAAQTRGVDPASCHAEKGEVIHEPTGRKVAYGKHSWTGGNVTASL